MFFTSVIHTTLAAKRQRKNLTFGKGQLSLTLLRTAALLIQGSSQRGAAITETQKPQSSEHPSAELSLGSLTLQLQLSRHLNQLSTPPQTPGM